ncbi:alpha/beta fold hydrolase [Umezawaea tangerina]|uniref:Pimeloyl-ACP methyl ester carboxylesterase n=1 Tax=Umezawaea tangerina TaxID=84725 RepID=A0A2T0SZZ0_9PSEU|nr:alpha/beta fold hydrolase [Umezawaea tangerina]PRY38988.1 pimeloyl-ACP methyl ester carboxylesterase [Umezawaea tangerina]
MIDFGGSGPQVLLLHGLGGSAEDWREFAGHLTDTHHVLAVDLRAELPWSWDIALADIEALDLDNPAVVGMSYGGMIAGRWAARHPECPAVISIDGHRGGLTAPANYPGMVSTRVESELAALRTVFEAQAQTPFLEVVFDAFVADDTIDAFAKAQCPTLVLLATRNIQQARDFEELMAAGRRGVERDLTTAAAANPNLTVVKVDGTHGMVTAQPAAIAAIVREYLPPSRNNL